MLKRKTLCIILSFGLMMHTGLASALSGHYIVITGFEIDENGNMTIHYNDSYPYANIPSQPKRTVSLSDMYTVGKSGGFGMEWAWIQ